MGIFARLGTLIKSNINDLITKAEDPEKMLAQVLLEMQQQLVDAFYRIRHPFHDVIRAFAGCQVPGSDDFKEARLINARYIAFGNKISVFFVFSGEDVIVLDKFYGHGTPLLWG